MRTIYLLCLIAVLLSAGACEDKNSSVKKPSDIEKGGKTWFHPVDKAKAQNEKLKNKVGSIIESQEVLKPF